MIRTVGILVVVSGLTSFAQAPERPTPAFEVASIKPVDSVGNYRFTFAPGGGFSGRLPLEWLIGIAYEVRPFDRIVGEPGWVRTQFFDVEAKSSGPVSRAETLAMLRALLDERFGLAWSRDPNGKATVYALTLAREGQQLGPAIRQAQECVKSAAPVPPVSERRLQAGVRVMCGLASAGGVHAGGAVPIRMLVSTIQLALGEEVIDRTGLVGNFDFYVTLPRSGQNPRAQDPAEGSIFTAIEEQLGMTLKREEIPRDVFVVERVSQPTPN